MKRVSAYDWRRIILWAALWTTPALASETEDRLTALKKELPFISTADFLYNRQPMGYERVKKIRAAWDTLQGLCSAELESAELVRLAEQGDAAIRCLAVLALVAQEKPDFVPVCIRLANDFTPTLPFGHSGDLIGPEMVTIPQTVADVARTCLQMVGCDFRDPNDAPKAFQPNAETWWEQRQSNMDWLGWHGFLHKRASMGYSPPQEEAKPALKQFWSQAEKLPPKTRAWLMLYMADGVLMSTGQWQDWYATEEEMIRAVRGLGAAALLEFLQTGRRAGLKEPAIDDPRQGRRFIITYAKYFFSPENAKDLTALKHYTAAMDADPGRARQVKDEAMQYHASKYGGWERAEVMAALADLGDETDLATVARWFYTESNGARGSTPQTVFLTRLEQRRPRAGKELIRLLASDPELDRLRPEDVTHLASLLKKITPDFSIERSWNDERADEVRGLLRAYFKIGSFAIQELKRPEKYLDKPEWSVELDGLAHSMVIHPNGSLLAVGMSDEGGGVRVLDAGSGKEKHRIAQSGEYLNVFFNPDGTQLLFHAPSSMGQIHVWDVASGKESWQSVEPQFSFQLAADKPFGLFEGESNQERFVRMDQITFKTLWTKELQSNRRRTTKLSPDAKWIALVDEEFKTIQLLDSAKEGELVTEFVGHASYPSKYAFSPDSTKLISVAEDDRVILWDVITKRMQSMFRGRRMQSGPVGFTADSQCFFANAEPNGLGVYSMDGTSRFGIKYTGNWMETVVPSRDGRFLFIMVQHASRPSGRADRSRIECWRLK
ncbi:MAG: WD40 repeat domain-containing protein [Prosthecobacter sp.]|uniref:WD40 repeat domain-containing protein n=1 Tax=Prosthecobacter sp. TaxID=1965333 RepID=UPI003BB1AECC